LTPDQIAAIEPRRKRVYHVHVYRRDNRLSYAEAGEQLGVTRNTVAGYERDYRRWYETDGNEGGATPAPDVRETGEYEAVREFVPVDSRRAALQAYLGTTFRAAPYAFSRHTTRTLVAVGDFHGNPDPEIVAALVRANADLYYIGGDTLDNQRASNHQAESKEEVQRRQSRGSREEFADIRAMLEVLISETQGNIRVFDGNHDHWPSRKIIQLLPDYLLQWFNDPLDMLLFGLSPRVERVVHAQSFRYPNGTTAEGIPATRFMAVAGDVLMSHMNFTAKQPGGGALKLLEWFFEWSLGLGLDHVRVLIQHHGHKFGKINRGGGHYTLIEPGMGGQMSTESYKMDYNAKWQVGVQGFVRIEQYQDANHDWHSDTASIDMIAPRLAHNRGIAA
jgi:hypothetical protein